MWTDGWTREFTAFLSDSSGSHRVQWRALVVRQEEVQYTYWRLWIWLYYIQSVGRWAAKL